MKQIDKLPYLIIDKDDKQYQLQIFGIGEGYQILYRTSELIYNIYDDVYKFADRFAIVHYDFNQAVNIMLDKLKEHGDDLQYIYSHPQDCVYKSPNNSSSDD